MLSWWIERARSKIKEELSYTLTCQETACWGTLYGTTCHVEDNIYIYIYIYINVGIWVSLRVSRLILRALKLTTM